MRADAKLIRSRTLLAFFVAFTLSLVACASGPEPMPAPTGPTAAPQVPPPEAPVTPAPEPQVAPTPPAQEEAENLALDTVKAGKFDNGKMWTFDYPPVSYFEETYGFAPDSAWFASARLGALRLSNCSASFVSPHGLVMTNHHCARESVEQVSRDGEDLVADGFFARTLADERPIEDYYADQLIEIRDVTDRVDAALEGVQGAQARTQTRQQIENQIVSEIEQEFSARPGNYNVEIVELYAGARSSAYIFRRYTDLRLVMSPEVQIAYFGGDWDNFTYPRYDLDMSFYRVYGDDGQPLEPDHYFPFSQQGVGAGDVVFVIGNPGSTSRLETVAQLEYRRDVSDQALVDLLRTRVPALQDYSASHPEEARKMDLRNSIFGFLNSLKAYTGMVEGLHDPVIMAKRRDHQRKFQAAIDADPALQAKYGGLIAQMADLQDQKREYAPELSSFLALGHPLLGSSTVNRALAAYQYLSAQSQGAPAQIVSQVRQALLAVPEQPREINEDQLIQRFDDFVRAFGPDHPFVQDVLGGRTPEGAAAVIMANTVLVDSASTAQAVSSNTLSQDDPAIVLAGSMIQLLAPAQQVQASVAPQEQEILSKLGQAMFDIYGTAVPPDATFSLRIADGVVKDYEYNGTIAPVHTTFFGMYDHYYSYGPDTDWALPDRWVTPPSSFDLATPLDFVSTADIIGGNSGSPVIDRNLNVVGLIFDGNIESLPGDYIYLPEKNRAVAVDVRGILEALSDVYGADRIVREVTTGELVSAGAPAPAGEGIGGR